MPLGEGPCGKDGQPGGGTTSRRVRWDVLAFFGLDNGVHYKDPHPERRRGENIVRAGNRLGRPTNQYQISDQATTRQERPTKEVESRYHFRAPTPSPTPTQPLGSLRKSGHTRPHHSHRRFPSSLEPPPVLGYTTLRGYTLAPTSTERSPPCARRPTPRRGPPST
jgi:hypothetical protein